MKIEKLENMQGGWFIGNFDPAILKSENFEVGLLKRNKGVEKPHYHVIATEYNILVSGSMTLNDVEITPGTIFVIDAGTVARPVFHEDSVVLCVKTPSVPGDKYEVL